ncbi:MAG: hypothetical protein ABJP34_09110 [Erythrobacter sp.]
MRGTILTLGLVLLACAGALKAEPAKLDIADDADWSHQWTAMSFPARWGEFTRDGIYQFEARETNVSAKYWDSDRDTLANLYLYRPGLAEASIWHDRALVALGASQTFGSEKVQGTRTASFTPSGGEAESGILTIIAAEGEFRSTSVAIYSAGDWLVKLRVSSRSLDPDGLEEMVRDLIKRIPALTGHSKRQSYVMEACLDEVNYADADRPNRGNSGSGNEGSSDALFKPDDFIDRLKVKPDQTAKYCREGDGGLQGSVYRPIGAKDRYMVAIGDSGASLKVAPAASLDSVLSADSSEKPYFLVSLRTGDKVRVFMPFLTLPQPNQAMQVLMREPPFTTIERGLGEEEPRVWVEPAENAPASPRAN